jgi:tetratricopeptide (TPR) repeat protein
MSRNILTFLSIVLAGTLVWSAPLDEIAETLARAEALYYEAEFTKSIELLLRLDKALQTQSDRLQEKTSVKLQLGLAYVGLNDNAQAKAYFRQLYVLNPDYVLDPQQFSPKVVQFADQAKSEEAELRCNALSSDAERQLSQGNTDALMRLIASNQTKCAGLSSLGPNLADLFFKEGLDAYRKAQMADAVRKFRSALRFEPKHELATQYIELAESKLQLDAERTLLAWRKDFDAGEFASAAKDYRRLVSQNNPDTVSQVRAEYRKALSELVDSWNRACATHDAGTMDNVRLRMNELLPEPSIGDDILAKMTACTNTGCVQMTSQLALARLKTRVDPDFPPYVRSQLKVTPVTVRVKTKINETGDVVVTEPQGGNALLYSAVQGAVNRWKFYPTILPGGEARCVETEIPIVITFKAN